MAVIGGDVDGIYSSPAVRGRQTVGPLAAAAGLPVHDLAELYEAGDFGEPAAGTNRSPELMVRALGGAWAAGRMLRAVTLMRHAHPRGRAVAASHDDGASRWFWETLQNKVICRRVACQDHRMGADEVFLGRLGPSLLALLPRVDERARRLVLGMAAEAAGEGGTRAVAALTGMAPQTVAKGAAELAWGQDPPPGRVRRRGGGRKLLADTDPGLSGALEALIRDAMRGDPESPLVWTTRSAEHLAGQLTAQGHRCSDSTVLRMLKRAGYTQQSNSRAQEGRRHPERDAQFRYIAAQAREHLDAGQPVISVDSKKKEQVGNYAQDGRE